ncbi:MULTISPECIES: efflux RND transporter periplasmic adaptor subunit [Olivibacter]|uniref:Efflux RND transporter periplasmic adaptor subunit n=1 Tax=Olivibacter oleidegradans TaxID=760123 RepID=A0ABV6HT67_9SPHI|nr:MULTISPECIES: efflux RND transporter periplasmic adaptor subunit [Olivibacter]QEL03888.1 efflux RND transporter periplasmic adaptor subunit [Olivibacter sp. LS-1]
MKKNMNIKQILAATVLILLLFSSCGTKTTETQEPETTVAEEENSNIVELSPAQYKGSQIKIGTIEKKSLSGVLKVNGFVDVPPENLYSITTQFGGIVKSTSLLQGASVRRGQVIAVLENQDYVQLQQDYLESNSQLELADAEYKRQLELFKQNVNAQKTVQQAKSQYLTMLSRTSALKERLKLININATTLNAENIRSTMNIYAPINGYVTKVNTNVGRFVAPNDVMFEIVNNANLHVELKVFEKDVSKVKKGQSVRFTLNNEAEERIAKVILVGREIDPDKTVTVHCLATIQSESLIPNTYIKAFIETGNNEVNALPEDGVVDYLGKKYIFIEKDVRNVKSENAPAEKMHDFQLVEVTTGLSEAGYVEVTLPKNIDSTKIVVNGAYDLLSKMKNSEEEE